jgi:hypothetical protein
MGAARNRRTIDESEPVTANLLRMMIAHGSAGGGQRMRLPVGARAERRVLRVRRWFVRLVAPAGAVALHQSGSPPCPGVVADVLSVRQVYSN